MIVKHANPCGVAVAETIEHAYAKALAADPVSAFGGVVVLNRAVGEELAGALAEPVRRGAVRPRLSPKALETLAAEGVAPHPRAHRAARASTRASATTGA